METRYDYVSDVEEFVSIKEAACYFYIHPYMIRWMVEKKAIPYIWDGEKDTVRFCDVMEFVSTLITNELLNMPTPTHPSFCGDSSEEEWVLFIQEEVIDIVNENLEETEESEEEGSEEDGEKPE